MATTKKKDATKFFTADSVRELRRRLGLNQTDFWALIGVTQSAGSRYECGRDIPKPIQKLLTLAYGSDKDAQALFDQLRRKEQQTQ